MTPRKRRNETVLRPVHPNAGLEIAYRGKLVDLVDEMGRSIVYWLRARYRQNKPVVAQDELPSDGLRVAIQRLVRQWNKRFDEAAGELGAYFAQDVSRRSDAALRAILKKAGIAIEWKMTRAMRDISAATVYENVALIKSIPAQFLTQVEGIVMRGVQTGRDLAQITEDLQAQHQVTRRRAAFIAKDQCNKATAAFTRARHIELGITEAIWVHSGAGKHPRPTHLAAGRDKVRYDVAEGWLDPALGKRIWPGTEINCRCVARAVIKGLAIITLT